MRAIRFCWIVFSCGLFVLGAGSGCGSGGSPPGGNPIPTLARESVTSAWVGSGPVPVSLTGTGFVTGAAAQWNGVAMPSSLVSSTELDTTIPVASVSSAGTAAITVLNPAPGGGPSNALSFVVSQPPAETGYVVGVDYHAYTTDFLHAAFVTQYGDPTIRATVQSQLQGIADSGGSVISTRIWMVTPAGGDDLGETWRAHFPLSDQEQTNLRAFAQDVAAVTGGNHLQLDLCLLWLGAADYTVGSPSTGIGYSALPASQFTAQVQLTVDKVLAAVSDVKRADGATVVGTVYFDGEIALEKANIQWFLSTHYPDFVSKVLAAGLRPSAYLQAECTENIVLDNGFTDSTYPVLNGHRSVARAYRMLHWMSDQGLYLAPRTDFDCYPISAGSPVSRLVSRVLDDADATFPSLGVPKSYANPETSYWLDSAARLEVGQAWAGSAMQNPRLKRVTFWTTPNNNDGLSDDVAYPFSVQDYLPLP